MNESLFYRVSKCWSHFLDYTEEDLKKVCEGEGEGCDTLDGLKETLFSCKLHNKLERIKFCRQGCIVETSPKPDVDDHCDPTLMGNGKEIKIQIEIEGEE